ncbi:MAG: hypothetical protein ABL962_21620, partial [Fimbriimonadaceae bacterium]
LPTDRPWPSEHCLALKESGPADQVFLFLGQVTTLGDEEAGFGFYLTAPSNWVIIGQPDSYETGAMGKYAYTAIIQVGHLVAVASYCPTSYITVFDPAFLELISGNETLALSCNLDRTVDGPLTRQSLYLYLGSIVPWIRRDHFLQSRLQMNR